MNADPTKVDQETFAIIKKQEEDLWRPETRLNRSLMEEIFAPDFFELGRSGERYLREDMFFDEEEIPSFDATLPLPDFAARWLAADVIQTTYISKVAYDRDIQYAHRSSIWSLMGSRWRLRFHQGTPTGSW